MDFFTYTTLLSVLFIGCLNVILFSVISKNKQARIFLAMSLFLIIWIITLKILYSPISNGLSQKNVLFIGRLGFFTPLLYLTFFSSFTYNLNESPRKIQLVLFYVCIFIALISTPIIFSSHFISEILYKNNEPIQVLGFFSNIISLTFTAIVLLSLINLAISYFNVSRTAKQQIKFISFGFLTITIITLITNLIIPFYTKINTSATILPISASILMGSVFFSIIKYQLFDIRLLLGKLFYHVLIATPPYLTFFILAYIYERVFGTSLNTVAYVMGVPIAILFTASLNLFTKFISEYTDTHLINPGYNPLVVLEQHRQRLSNTLDIEKIILETLFIIARTIRPSTSGIVLMGKEYKDDWLSINYKKPPYDNPKEFKTFTEYFSQRTERVVNYEELSNARILEDTVLMQNRHLSSQMEKYNIGLIVVIKEEATIKGILLIGKKEANEPYNSQEIKFLISLADSMSMALGRALLHKETQQFNEDLKQKITEATSNLQKKNNALEEALEQLEEIRRQEKDMIDVMGHELRTPISITRNALLTLQKHLEVNNDGINPEKVKKYTNMAVEGARREIALVETLLSTTKLEGGRMQIDITSVNLDEVVKYSLRSHSELAKKNNTQVVYNKSTEDIVVLADKIRIQEIMDNFLNNAIKYTGQGKVEISIYKQDKLGWIDVKDSGIGISEENLKNLGKKFFRAQNLYNQSANIVNPSGTGLGLFVSFLLIEMMKGEKRIISKEGEGSVFSFGLPLYIDPK